jgi:hypothetical protein
MLSFKDYLAETAIKATGAQGDRHSGKYIKPFIGQKDTHTLNKDAGGIKSGSKVTVHSTTVKDGKHFATVSSGGKKVEVPHSHLEKPQSAVTRKGDAGFSKETEIANHLKKHGLMDKNAATAGSTGGHDFHIINKTQGKKFGGTSANEIAGESKISLKAKMGAAAFAYHPEKGWHVSDRTRKAKPKFAAAIEKATVNGKPLLHHMNDHWGDPKKAKHLPNITTDNTDLHPLHAYAHDHGVDVLHIHTHGTYRVGMSEHKDRVGAGLPKPKGTGRFTIGPERAGGNVHGAFRVHEKNFDKSHTDIMRDDHAKAIAKKLGH